MPQNEDITVDPIAGGTFSGLLFSDTDVADAVDLLNNNHHHNFTFSTDEKPSKMLCFGQDYMTQKNPIPTKDDNNNNACSPSSTTTSLSSKSIMKRNLGSEYCQPDVNIVTNVTTVAPSGTNHRSNKKMREENTPPASHAKVKKEKLGERIAALQKMVSPYGKTDTASVLHEAMGYIKFLQEQVQVLCSPYLKRLPATHIEGQEDVSGERKKDLWARGLCLVPVECTRHVAESNGADMWSPAMVNCHGSSGLH